MNADMLNAAKFKEKKTNKNRSKGHSRVADKWTIRTK